LDLDAVSGGEWSVGCGMGVLDGMEIVEWEGAVLRVNVGHRIVINGDFVA